MKKEIQTEITNLRQKAEGLLKKRPLKKGSQPLESEMIKLIHELEVHQIELEMQNEELMLKKKEIEELATEKYTELYDFAPSGYFTLSKEGKIIELNLCGSQMLGKERSLLKNRLFGFYVTNDTKPIFNQFLNKVFNNKAKEICEVTLSTNNNSPLYVFLTGITTDKGEHCLVTMVDITHRKKAEKELIKTKEKAEESDRLKSAFLQNMSHEIRNPMNAIIGFSEMLEKHDLTKEKQKIFINNIIYNSHKLLLNINNIITISSLETKQEKVIINKVSINQLMNDLLLLFEKQTLNRNISIFGKPQLTDKQSEIYTDKTKVIQILSNLINNALKFTPQGFIEFGYNLKNNNLEFYVKDSGIGIKAEMQGIIFNHFRQVDEKDNRKYEGTGLGLSISKAFIELLNGKIWVESEPENGSTFYFTIPYKPVDKISK